MTDDRSLEERLRAIEDRLEIYDIIASHPPSADTGGDAHIAESWVEDGVCLDRADPPTRGRKAIADQVLSPGHQAAIARGLAHFTSLPRVAISGDHAVVTSYLQIVVPQTQGDAVECQTMAAPGAFASTASRPTAGSWCVPRGAGSQAADTAAIGSVGASARHLAPGNRADRLKHGRRAAEKSGVEFGGRK